MKKILFFIICSLLILTTGNAEQPSNKNKEIQINRTIASLLQGLQSDNLGLKSGCIYMLGELKIDQAVIPLMKILKKESDEELKIAAALALYKIRDSRGMFSIKRAVKFENSERVKKFCDLFYRSYLGENISHTSSLLSVK